MVCTDRQLTEAQRAEAFEQNRNAGALKAIRPFTGEATPENLVDYLNREVYPVLRQARSAVNEIYRQVTDNAPSGNPLGYFFSASLAGDPTAGRLSLDNATQENATTIRVNQQNSILRDITPWLDVMAGSSTAPLGVVTLTAAPDPSRYIRWDLNTMTDQGSYWDLDVTVVESSHPNPFVPDGAVVLAFIPGVASSGAVPVPSPTSSTWADVLANGSTSGANNPSINSGQSVIFAGVGASPAGGDIDAAGDLTLDSVGDMHLHASGGLHLGHTGITNLVHIEADAEVDIVAGADILEQAATNIAVQAGTDWSLSTGATLRLTVESDGSWLIGGSNGTTGQYLRSFGTAAPPQWSTVDFSEITGGTWEDSLSRGNNSGAFNPHVDTGQFLGFGIEGSLPASGDIRASSGFLMNVTGLLVQSGSTGATFQSGTTGILLTASSLMRFTTGGTERLEIEATGGWQLGGLVGSAGQYIRSAGAGASPAWATISVGELGTIAAETFLGNFTAGSAAPAAVAGSTVAGAGLTYTTGGILAVGAGTNVTVNANDVAVTNFPLTGLATQAANTIVANVTGSAAAPTAVAVAADSVLARVGGNLVSHPWSTLFGTYLTYSAGVADWLGLDVRVNSGALTGTRHRLNVIGTSPITVAGADDGASDEVDVTISVSAIPLTSLATQADDTFLANISGGAAAPTAVALTTLAGAGLTGGADAILAVGAGTRITVNANDVQLATGAAESFLMNATAGVATADYRAGSSVAGAGLTYTAGGTLAVGAGTNITVNANDVAIDQAGTYAWTGAHGFSGAVAFSVGVGSDVSVASTTGGLWLSAGHTPVVSPSVSNGDVLINAANGAGLFALATPATNVGVGDVEIRADATVAVFTNGTERLQIESDGAWQLGGDTGTANGTMTSQGSAAPPTWQIPVAFTEIFSSAVTGKIDNLAIGDVNVVRLTPNAAQNVTGMVPPRNGQLVILINAATVVGRTLRIVDESDATNGSDSSAANRFALFNSTSQTLLAESMTFFWYDTTVSRWRTNQ